MKSLLIVRTLGLIGMTLGVAGLAVACGGDASNSTEGGTGGKSLTGGSGGTGAVDASGARSGSGGTGATSGSGGTGAKVASGGGGTGALGGSGGTGTVPTSGGAGAVAGAGGQGGTKPLPVTGGAGPVGGAAPVGGSATADAIPLDQVVTQTSTAACPKLAECCAATGGLLAIPTICAAAISTAGGAALQGIQPSVAAGRIRYHSDALVACLERVKVLPCAEATTTGADSLSDCTGPAVFEPVVSAGGACTSNRDCVDGYCDTATQVCVARKADGGACVAGAECVSGNCTSAVCAAALPSGSICALSTSI